MIKHIVFWQLEEIAEGKSKAENARIIKEGLEGLKDRIPQLQKIEVGINHADAPQSNYDVALYCELASMADLDIYQNHPDHKAVAAYIGKVKKARVAVDYEVDAFN